LSNQTKNQLADETSPYLLEHADNPVNWYPWSEEALQKARDEDKPIFLSIGYSACHWCHVMKRESFQDPETAEVMNDLYVNIKVDREERPDLDEIYMQAVQAMTGRGGWPMSVFLTPDLEPFYGGTYFPPEPKQGMPDFRSVLKQVHQTYREKPEEVRKSADKLKERLDRLGRSQAGDDLPEESWLDRAYQQLSQRFDDEWGGFGDAPKFPRVMDLQLLFRLDKHQRFSQAYSMIKKSLDGMMQGGIYDQVGGGFARYSTDAQWLVPHFEKMLYDNAQLLDVYTNAYRIFDDDKYREVAEQTYDYMVRDLGHPEGVFYSSQDAESDGEEGKYYVWSRDEFYDVLGEDADLLADYWGVTEAGNFEGNTILNRTASLETFCSRNELDPESFQDTLDQARSTLLEAREQREKPHLDDKILTSWNGLALAACARAGFVFDRDEYVSRAEEGLEFLLETLVQDGELYHTHREGKTHTPAFLDDYAFLIKAFLELFQVTGDSHWLDKAEDYFEKTAKHFWDGEDGGFFFASERHENLIVRSKNPQEKAEPSGNSEMILNALKLNRLTGDSDYRVYAEDSLKAFVGSLEQSAVSMTRLLCGLHDYYSDSVELVSVSTDSDETLLDPIRHRYIPGSVLVQANPDTDTEDDLPLLEGRLQDPVPAVYVCTNGSCQRPATSQEELTESLESLRMVSD
jgi:uncharacterized protein YyaL (SSP411 family)